MATHPLEIMSQTAYPPDILERIRCGRNHLILVANRWMLGWPERVQTLLAQGEYWSALERQTEQEIDALAESTPEQVQTSTPWEIVEQAGLDLAPPVP